MLRSFLTLSLRNLFRKNLLFTLINIIGLAIGLACLLMATLFIYDEYTYDTHNTKAHRTYRIVVDFKNEGTVVNWARSSAAVGHYLSGAYPEVEHVMRLRKNAGTDLLGHEEIQFYEERIFFADSTLFDVFDIKLKNGNTALALNEKNTIVLTRQTAEKYFGQEEALGKTLRYNNQLDLKVTGIMEAMPANAHFVADGFISFSSLDELFGEKRLMHWGQFDHHTYVLLTNGSTPDQLEHKFPDFLKTYAPEWVSEKMTLLLQPLLSIHLHSNRKDEITVNSNESYSYILGTVASFILLMACANFVNLSTVIQTFRFKQIAIQKILGINASNLILYFWIESLLMCLLAFMAALLFAQLALPHFNLITGKHLTLWGNYMLILPIAAIAAAIGLVSGVFPAWQSVQINLARLIKLNTAAGVGSRSSLRSALVTFQFSISILLTIATWIATSQFAFLTSMRVGFNSNNVAVISIKDRSQNERHTTMVNELLTLRGVEKASFSASTPGANNSFTYTYTIAGAEAGEQTLATFIVDEHFFDLYEIKLKAGRLLNPQRADTLIDVVLNEAAVKQLQLSNPIGQFVTGKVKGRVVGVVENFNHTSLRTSIDPVIMYAFIPTFRMVSVKLKEGEQQIALAGLEKKWQELYPGYPLEYALLNDQIEQLYGAEFQLSQAYRAFSIIAISIAFIGLIGLTTFLLTKKLKEISIRKVFGSPSHKILFWIYSGYIKIMLAASLLAWTIGYYFMQNWLNAFAYKISIHVVYFLFPTLIMIAVLLLATGIQALKAAQTNPAHNLREE